MSLLDLSIGSSLEELQTIADRVDAVAEQQGWSQRTVFALQVSLDEWISNVIKYSYKNQPGQVIRVTLELDGDLADQADLLARVEDQGAAFDPTAPGVMPALDKAALGTREGGMGLFVMQHLLKDIGYQNIGGRNIVTLRVGL